MSFSESAWSAIDPIYQSILEHPFNQELAKGTLTKKRFQFYMKQDSLYLIDFARALAIAASWKTPAKVRTAPTVAASSPASFDKCDALSNLFIRLPDLKFY